MAGCFMISAKMTIIKQQPFSVCNPTLSNHRMNFAIPPPQSGGLFHYHSQSKPTRLIPIKKKNFQCPCTKRHNPAQTGLWRQMSRFINWIRLIRNILFHVWSLRTKKKKPYNISLDELAGVDAPLAEFQPIIDSLQRKKKREHDPFGILIPPYGVLVHGPLGAGKTTLVHLVAQKAGVSFFPLTAFHILHARDENFIKSLFDEARRCSPSIIYISYVEFIASSENDPNLSKLCYEMDICKRDGSVVLLIVATHKCNELDSTFLTNWFLSKVYVGYPDEDSRRKIVALNFKGALREQDKEAIFNLVTSQTSGLPWGVLRHIARESRSNAKLTRGDVYVTMDDVVKVLEEL